LETFKNIFGVPRLELERTGIPTQRATAVFQSLYPRPNARANPVHQKTLAELKLHYNFDVPLRLEHTFQSRLDGSVKFVFALESGRLIESVYIPENGRNTLCVSSQVGCAQGCHFCQTGRMGLLQNLSAAEIVGQVLAVNNWLCEAIPNQSPNQASKITNVVFMGMGEPLDNLTEVVRAIHILTDEQGLRLSPNRVTVSTVGLVKPLEEFLKLNLCSLALSLHNPICEERSRIIPTNKSNSISEVINVLRKHLPATGRTLFVQYTLLRGANDTQRHADAFVELLQGIPFKVNLIPLNEHRGTGYRRPSLDGVRAFQAQLKQKGIVTTVRLSKGRDIEAACGQLIQDLTACKR
jgi:23S rRNA (adenine2503-C2)-methyltransferase